MAGFYPISIVPFQFINPDDGELASGFTLESFVAGTSTPTNMYSDKNGTVLGTTVTMNSAGYPVSSGNPTAIWLQQGIEYKFILKDEDSNTEWTLDELRGEIDTNVSVVRYDSVAAMIADSPSVDVVFVNSYYGGWTATVDGPRGAHYMHKTGATNTAPTVGAPVSVSTIGTGTQAGYRWDAAGAEWKISYHDSIHVDWLGARGDGDGAGAGTDDSTAIADAVQLLHDWPTDTVYRNIDFGVGTYRIDSTITIPRTGTYTSLRGVSRGSTWFDFTNATTGIILQSESTDFHDITFIGASTTTIVNANNLNDAADIDVTFHSCTFDSANINVIVEGRGAKFYGCAINTYETGTHLRIIAPDPFLEGGAATQKRRTGMRRYIINGCDIDGVGRLVDGINTTIADQSIHGLTITGNHGASIRQLIVSQSIIDCSIDGNTFISSRTWPTPADAESYIQAKIIRNLVIDGNIINQYSELPVDITGATQANPVVITAPLHGYSNSDTIYISQVGGMTEINSREFTVANVTTNTFELSGEDGTGHTLYTTGGVSDRISTTNKVAQLLAVINDPTNISDTTNTADINAKNITISNNTLGDIRDKLVFFRCYADDIKISNNTLNRFAESTSVTPHLVEVIDQIRNLIMKDNTVRFNKAPASNTILVNLGSNTSCANLFVENNEVKDFHTIFSAEPSGDSTVRGQHNFTPVLNINGTSAGISYSSRAGNYYRVGPIVFFNLGLTLSSKGVAVGDVTLSGLPFGPAPLFNSSGGTVAVDGWGGSINEYGNTNLSPDIQYVAVRSDGQIRLYKNGVTQLQNTDILNNFFIRICGMYYTLR